MKQEPQGYNITSNKLEFVRNNDGTSTSLRRCSSLVHVHQNELVQLVQSLNFSQRTKRNGWTVELAYIGEGLQIWNRLVLWNTCRSQLVWGAIYRRWSGMIGYVKKQLCTRFQVNQMILWKNMATLVNYQLFSANFFDAIFVLLIWN